jgi:hypothetical protein
MSTKSIFYKIPGMVYSGLFAGILLEVLIQNEDARIKKQYVFAGICIATWTSYYLQN